MTTSQGHGQEEGGEGQTGGWRKNDVGLEPPQRLHNSNVAFLRSYEERRGAVGACHVDV
eukprot:CAMPEP_0113691136 /NCGR_PEP_ID=MMETSP0038_2-20120614/18243_1 /TAXON_ID=2898 /ORGANISM="Cryptomonas paramecium" /LENGTH=58 /DNA_ID=CAMNT_0000612667 /DNA_START=130 /DNA_END=303 /DNA_ORIENTATION=+ /assembly_acc=CAM_ASM_000170